MHADRTHCPCKAVTDEVQRIVMIALLASGHSPFSRAELEREVSGSKDRPIDVSDAIEVLYAAGLVNVAGELVTPSRAALHMDELLGSPL
ncbi:MAG TPA: hypothetical protein VN672_05725 [Solirubrobacteraceae bacterium]|nr:hypothetical protein [Solirubrobacteraceae bacterium]